MNKWKKIVLIIAALAILSYTAYKTYAYFTTEQSFIGTVSIGKVKIELIEKQVNQKGEEEAYQDEENLYPGKEVSRIISVRNTGTAPQYVRVHIVREINGDSQLGEKLIILLELNETDWTKVDDYFYYNLPVEVNEETKELFKGFKISEELGNDEADGTVKFIVEAQATQVANNGTSALDAKGWPE